MGRFICPPDDNRNRRYAHVQIIAPDTSFKAQFAALSRVFSHLILIVKYDEFNNDFEPLL